jgi:hypothetical protein
MHEFETAYHHYTCVVRKKRLVLLVTLENPLITVSDSDDDRETCDNRINLDSLRQYLRHYTYIDCNVSDWFVRLLYSMPMKGMLEQQEQQQQEQQQQQQRDPHQTDEQEPRDDFNEDDALLIQ